jgi:hypothetical protein
VGDAGDTFDGDRLDAVRTFYSGIDEGSAVTAAAVPVDGEDESGGDADEDGNNTGVSAPRASEVSAEEMADGGDDVPTVPMAVDGDPSVGQVRDLGDVIEVPILEEQVVKRPVVKEVVRVKKVPKTQQATVSGDVRREDVEVTRTSADDGD